MSVLSLPRSFDLSRNKTEHPRGWETKNPSRSPFLYSPEITKMRKIIYYGISSDAPCLRHSVSVERIESFVKSLVANN